MNFKLVTVPLIFCSFSIFGQSTQADVLSSIERITVTASPDERPLLSLSSNLSIIDGSNLSLVEQQHVNQVMVRVPGGWISRGNGQEHLTALRSPVLTGAGGCGAFFIAQDGISLRGPGFCNINQLFDSNTEQADRIEVLRGPSSVNYGSNAVHGVINVISPDAFQSSGINVGIEAGANDYYRARFRAGSSQHEQALLIYGNIAQDAGYKESSGFEQQKLNIIHQIARGALSIKSVFSATNLKQDTAGFIKGFEAYKNDALKTQNPNPEAYRNSQSFRAYSQIDYQVDEHSLVSFTPFFRWADMAFLQHFLPWQSVEENDQVGMGFRANFTRQVANYTWHIGVDSDYTDAGLIEYQDEPFSPTIPQGQHYNYQVNALVLSPYAQVDWWVTDRLTLNAGLRFDNTSYDYDNRLSTGSACESHIENCRFMRPADQKVHYNESSFQLGGHYVFADNHSAYMQMSTGHRAPQATELFRLQAGQLSTDLSAEKLTALELGVRGQSNQLFYDVTAFAMEKEHFIFQDTNRQNVSDGETTHLGIEFSFLYQLPRHLFLGLNGTLANHRYDSSLTLSRQNIRGNEIDTAPQHMGSVQLGWQHEEIGQAELEWVHMGNYYVNPENTAEYEGHNLLNLRLSKRIKEDWLLSLRVLNLTDQDYAERADFGFGDYRYFVGEPRSIFASINYTFH